MRPDDYTPHGLGLAMGVATGALTGITAVIFTGLGVASGLAIGVTWGVITGLATGYAVEREWSGPESYRAIAYGMAVGTAAGIASGIAAAPSLRLATAPVVAVAAVSGLLGGVFIGWAVMHWTLGGDVP